LRQKAGLSQNRLAKILGIPQRSLSFYERDAKNLPSSLVPRLADALGVTIEDVLGMSESQTRKRGPKSQLEKQMEAIGKLPRSKQQQIAAVIEAFIAQHAER
jgi:transcriptional regulator with XRE-family HTH domain